MAEQVQLPVVLARHVTGDLFKAPTQKQDRRTQQMVDVPPEEQKIYAGFMVTKAEFAATLWPAMWQAVASDPKGAPLLDSMNAAGIVEPATQFKWKVIDGDQPDKDGQMREWAAGCYIIRAEYPVGRFGRPLTVIDGSHRPLTAESGAKRGDWYNVGLNVKFNDNLDHNAGLFVNVDCAMWVKADEQIGGTGGVDTQSRFAGMSGGAPVATPSGLTPSAPQTPPTAPQTPPTAPQTPPTAPQTPPTAPQTPPTAPQTPPTAPQTPPTAPAATDPILQPPAAPVATVTQYEVSGQWYTREQLAGWTDEQVASLPQKQA